MVLLYLGGASRTYGKVLFAFVRKLVEQVRARARNELVGVIIVAILARVLGIAAGRGVSKRRGYVYGSSGV